MDREDHKNKVATSATSASTDAKSSRQHLRGPDKDWFRSRRIKKGAIDKPWLANKDPREKLVTIIPLVGIIVGVALAGLLIWDGMRSVTNHEYCTVLDEDWSEGFDENIWTKEAQVGGFGNGEFEETTADDENVFVEDGLLYIRPTLQDEDLINSNGSLLNLTNSGICTSTKWSDCWTTTNMTNGSIINPVKSGRITTRKAASIKFGRVEVTAKLPAGDWMWPAIWMLPVNNTYGEWPRSGEIDIMESRGNNWTFAQGGNDVVSSTLHWGPDIDNDAWWRDNVKRQALHSTYSDKFHTFGLEWSEKYLFTYVDSRLAQTTYTPFKQLMWQRGHFPLLNRQGNRLVDPWSYTGRASTPFDQDFFLILNVAIGGTNGWFTDGTSGKPWVDASNSAKLSFWNARSQWLPTWQKSGYLVVKRVVMLQQKGYNGC